MFRKIFSLFLIFLSLQLTASALHPLNATALSHASATLQKRKRSRPLWPGSRYTEADRARALQRGLRFIYRTALDKRNFAEYGHDYLWCFYTIGTSVQDAAVRDMAYRLGVERAQQWRHAHPRRPGNP